MRIHGIGIISSTGRGVENFAKALQQGPSEPKFLEYSSITKRSISAFSIDDALLRDKDILKNSRRADRFCKMAVLAACDAFADSGIEAEENEKIGIIVATAFGPHKTTFNFLDNILDYGDNSVSPTIFSHSVHNAAASYITSALNIKGPASTLTDFCFPFHNALQLADAWINQGRCRYVLVGTVDELSPAMEYICDQKLNILRKNKREVSSSDNSGLVLGEGSVFFLLSDGKKKAKYCCIECVYDQTTERKGSDQKNLISFTNSPVWGWIASGLSFHCASEVLMFKKKYFCQKPISLRLQNGKNNALDIESASFFCGKERGAIELII